MATIALTYVGGVIGGYFGGPVGAFIGAAAGSAIGSYIDGKYVYPAIFGGNKGPLPARIHDIQLQSSAEGDSMKIIMGPYNRVAGTIIFCSKLIEVKHEGSSKGGKPARYYYYVNIAVGLGEGVVQDIKRVWANGKLIYANGKLGAQHRRMTLYPGDEFQFNDTTIEDAMGFANVPPFRGTAYVMFEHLALADFGNTIPQMTFEVQAQVALRIVDAFANLMARAGITAGQYAMPLGQRRRWQYLLGYTIAGPQNLITCLEPLLNVFDTYTRESNGVINFVRRGWETRIAVSAADLTSREFKSTSTMLPTRPIKITDVPDNMVPNQVRVRYVDLSYYHQQGEMVAKIINHPYNGSKQYDFPIVLYAKDARYLAENKLLQLHGERQMVEGDLPPSYLHVEENDILVITYAGTVYEVRIDQIDRGENWQIKFKGVLGRVSDAVDAPGECRPPTPIDITIYDPTPANMILEVYILDVPAIASSQVSTPGLFYAVKVISGSWRGGEIFINQGGIWQDTNIAANTTTTMGYASTVLADGTPYCWDTANTVNVVLWGGDTLVSKTLAEVLAGENWMYIGNELIGFATATLVAPATYKLSRLLRGRNSSVMTGHLAGERAVMIDSDLTFGAVDYSLIGTTQQFEVVPEAGVVGIYPNHATAIAGNTLKQYCPTGFTLARDGARNATITWNRRTRMPFFQLLTGPTEAPLLAANERYVVEFVHATFLTVYRTVTADGPGVTYTAAMQTEDIGGTSPNNVRAIVYQLNDLNQRGFPSEAFLIT